MAAKKTKPLIVWTTVSKKVHGAKIAKILVEQKLAACVTILPGSESRYTWKGKVCVEKEFILMIKTLSTRYKKLEQTLKSIHPYDCPEIIGLPVEKISSDYGRWLKENTSGA